MADSTLGRIVENAQIHAAVSRLTRDPDPAPTHDYQPDPQSGAGNCTCGAAEHHRRHPHTFTPARVDPALCVCALPEKARCHAASRALLRVFVNGEPLPQAEVDVYGWDHSASPDLGTGDGEGTGRG